MKRLFLLISLLLCTTSFAVRTGQVPFTFELKDYSKWEQLLTAIESTSEPVVLYWAGYGGNVEKMEEIYSRLAKQKGHVTIVINGQSISAHGMVICYLKDMVVFNKGSVTLHSATKANRDSEGNKRFDNSESYRILDKCLQTGWISKAEENLIVSDRQRITIHPNGHHQIQPDWK